MSRAKLAAVPLHQLTPGQDAVFFAVLAERTRGATREGKPYFTCRFRDLRRTVAFMVWADGGWFDDCEHHWQVGQFFKIRGRYAEHERYGPQIDIQKIRPANDDDREFGFDPDQLVEKPRRDPAALVAELLTLVDDHITDAPLRRLVRTIVERHAGPLQRLPATTRNFYPFPGGLVEHIVSVTRTCLLLADRYAGLQPPLDRDLVVAGAVLHDMGRVLELADDPAGAQPTVSGRLVGHLFLGRDLVRDTARELGDLDAERVQLLEHLIVSHLNHPEWGSPRLPLLPECLILHHADDLDAKLEMFARCLDRDPSPGPFTERDPVLGRRLYKGRRADTPRSS